MKITKYAQSCFLLETDKLRILIDPGNLCYSDSFKPKDFGKVDVLLLTHTHNDHCFSEAVKEIKENNPDMPIIGNDEVAAKLKEEAAMEDITEIEVGDKKEFDKIKVEVIKGIHGKYPIMKEIPKNVGFVIDDGKTTVYHSGDTLYYEGMPKVDVALLPICNNFVVMGIEDVYKYAKETNPKLIIPMHYDGPKHPRETKPFEVLMTSTNTPYKILKDGESVEV